MKKIITVLSVIFLLINGIGALYGSYGLISDPSGEKMQLPLSLLENSPFRNYLLPGIILLIVNSLVSFIAMGTIVANYRYSSLFIFTQGILLSGWIIMQVIILHTFYALFHATFLGIGLFFIYSGIYLRKMKSIEQKVPIENN